MEKTVKYLAEVEEVAQDVLTNKESKLELSNAHNKYREAFRALQQADSTKTWIKCGLVYVEMNVEDCKSYLKKGKYKNDLTCRYCWLLVCRNWQDFWRNWLLAQQNSIWCQQVERFGAWARHSGHWFEAYQWSWS